MAHSYHGYIEHIELFKQQAIQWADQFPQMCLLNSNRAHHDRYGTYECVLAVQATHQLRLDHAAGAFELLKEFTDRHPGKWLFGALSYDLKNGIEQLSSANPDWVGFPVLHFFVPDLVLVLTGHQLVMTSDTVTPDALERVFLEIINLELSPLKRPPARTIQSRVAKEAYLAAIAEIKQHIAYGDIYEMNFCQEFYVEGFTADPVQLYRHLNTISPAPFSCFYKDGDKYLLSASPERFLKKQGQKIISQPIKGTRVRGQTDAEDWQNKEFLRNHMKDITENIMIVDLVRNDLSKTAKRHSVRVEELCGIYSFRHVHQMISTVVSELNPEVHWVDAIKQAFPMGSMTGAPKIRAMELMEQFESTKRGLFSGSVGYITPERDFDLNVVIRSALYNSTTEYLSSMAGGAITAASDPETEYDECLLKAKAFFELIGV